MAVSVSLLRLQSLQTAVCMAAAFGWIWRAVTCPSEEMPALRRGEKAEEETEEERAVGGREISGSAPALELPLHTGCTLARCTDPPTGWLCRLVSSVTGD